jgi:hypothetical protein
LPCGWPHLGVACRLHVLVVRAYSDDLVYG